MGLFDKIKAVKNAVTGGSARVYVQAKASTTEPFTVTVRAEPENVTLLTVEFTSKLEVKKKFIWKMPP